MNMRVLMQNIFKMGVRHLEVRAAWVLSLAVLALTACATSSLPETAYIALLAPFEGRYREVGYDLLYAARLGLADAGYTNLELLPIDDGGSVSHAADRAHALALNPRVRVALVAGNEATHADVLNAFNNVPVVVIGLWDASPIDEDIFILANADIPQQITAPDGIGVEGTAALPAPLRSGDIFALKQFPKLREDLSGITVLTSAQLPDTAFTERFVNSGQFVQPPGLLVTLAYDATRLTAQAVGADSAETPTRRSVRDRLLTTEYAGLNGTIRFENGYWADAPIYNYSYNAAGELAAD